MSATNNDDFIKSDEYWEGFDDTKAEKSREKAIAESNKRDGTFHIRDNGNGDARKEHSDIDNSDTPIIPALELDPYIPDRDYAEYYINVVKKTVRREDSFVRQVFYTALSKDSDDPLNLAVLATTSEGKTYGIIQTLQYFSDKGLWYIGSMTSKVIVRQNGLLTDSNYQPLKPQLKDLKKAIEDA